MRIPPRLLFNLYPPFVGAGIRIRKISKTWDEMVVEMKLRWYNRNYVGTHYGGSLYSMCDPFLMIMMIRQLGKGYIVWDKAASIRFRKPGRGRMRVRFLLPPERTEEIRKDADENGKTDAVFVVEVNDDAGDVVAQVEKTIHVRVREPRQQ
jgi:acyl-coenzyme A thioesterase PaaI-like protein